MNVLQKPWAAVGSPELAIVIPTFNEAGNVERLVSLLNETLAGIAWEAIFVDDDSQDGTVAKLEQTCGIDPRIRCIRRFNRRGLASAVVEGIQSTFAPFVAVMDADLQHDERLLGPMLHTLRDGAADLVVGSRYTGEGGVGDWDRRRHRISLIATQLSRLVLKGHVLHDPMSGFFMIRREAFEAVARDLSIEGYKILLDIVATSPTSLRIAELPYTFRERTAGTSKLDSMVVLDYAVLLLDKLVGRWIPPRFIIFTAVGGFGLIFHMSILAVSLALGAAFLVAQTLATFVAMTINFFLNNTLTYRDKRLKGLGPVAVGLLSFYSVCLFGSVANIGIANFMFKQQYSWWAAGLCGVLIGAVWNYAASSAITWRK